MKLPYGTAGKLSAKFPAEGFPEHARNFAEQVQLYKALAMSGWNDASPDQNAKMEAAIARFKELKKRLDDEVEDFASEDFSKPGERLDNRIASITMFMYLFDKTIELHEAVMKKGKAGLYALFDSTRNSIYSLLSSGFFMRAFTDDVGDYIADEPLLVACADLAEVDLLPLHEAITSYQPKLEALVLALINEEGEGGDETGKQEGTGSGDDAKDKPSGRKKKKG